MEYIIRVMAGNSMNKQMVIKAIVDEFSGRFRVIDNTGENKKIISGQFPDVIIMRPEPPVNQDVLFVMKLESGQDMLDSISEWKDLSNGPGVLYIVIPQESLDEAKKLASVTGIKARFAPYNIGANKARIRYE